MVLFRRPLCCVDTGCVVSLLGLSDTGCVVLVLGVLFLCWFVVLVLVVTFWCRLRRFGAGCAVFLPSVLFWCWLACVGAGPLFCCLWCSLGASLVVSVLVVVLLWSPFCCAGVDCIVFASVELFWCLRPLSKTQKSGFWVGGFGGGGGQKLI